MINLKLSNKESKEMSAAIEMDRPEYPYGTHISLEDDQLEELKLDAQVGDQVTIRAIATVTDQNERKSEGGEDHTSMGFQITDIEVQPATPDRVEVLYGDKG